MEADLERAFEALPIELMSFNKDFEVAVANPKRYNELKKAPGYDDRVGEIMKVYSDKIAAMEQEVSTLMKMKATVDSVGAEKPQPKKRAKKLQ